MLLQVIEIHVPSLRQHASDVPALIQHLLERCCRRTGRLPLRFTEAAMQLLRNYDWPGNVRELRNVVERAVVLAEGPEITESDRRITPGFRSEGSPDAESAEQPGCATLDEAERRHIIRAIESTGWKKRETARILGINRATLDRKLERYGIRPPPRP